MRYPAKTAQASRRAQQEARKGAEKRFLCLRRNPVYPGEMVRVVYSADFLFGEATIIAFVSVQADAPLKRVGKIAETLEIHPALLGRPLDASRKIRRIRSVWRFRSIRPGNDDLLREANAIAQKIRTNIDFPVYVSPFFGLTRTLLDAQALE